MFFRRKVNDQKRRAARRAARRIRLEPLEQRLPLAGNVAAAIIGGNLLITGDADDNDITIDDDGVPGRVVITPNGTTTLNGFAVPQIFQATGDIRLRMGDGSDTVDFNGLGGSTPRDLMYDGGDGDNVFSLDDYTVGRNLAIQNDDGLDTVTIDAVFARGIAISNGDGGSVTDIVNGTTVTDDLRITNRNGDNTINVDSDGVDGDVTIRNGDGTNTIDLSISTIGDDVLIRNGDGDVTISLDAATIGDDVVIRNGDGFHDIELTGGSIGDDTNIRNGDGRGSLDVTDQQIDGHLNIRNGEATDTTILLSVIGGNICSHDGDGVGTFTVSNSNVGGDIVQSSRDGDYTVTIDGGTYVGDDVTLRNGDGANVVTINETEVDDDIVISNRNGDNTIVLGDVGLPLDVDGRVYIRNGDGDNTITVDQAAIDEDLLIRNGDSTTANSVSIGEDAPVLVGRDLQMISGEGDSQTLVNAVTVVEDFRLSTRGGSDSITMTGTLVGDLSVGRYASVETGRGDDTLFVGTDVGGVTNLQDVVRIRMGGDADSTVIGEGTVMNILISSIDGGSGAPDVLTVTNQTAFNPFDPANAARLRNWELIVS